MALVPFPAPYDFHLSTRRFRAYGPDLATLWADDALWRVVDGSAVRIAAAAGPAAGRAAAVAGEVEVTPDDPGVVAAVRVLLGASHDLTGFAAFVAASGDAALQAVHARLPGFRPPLAPDPFEALVTAITAQQVSLFSAGAVRNRLIAAYGEPGLRAGASPVPRDDASPAPRDDASPVPAPAAAAPAPAVHAFPRPERLAAVDPAALLPLGCSRRKAEYVVGVAQGMAALDGIELLADDEVKARLVGLRGLGEWSADWFLARHLGRPRAWPAGDLVLRKACSRLYADGRDLSTAEVRALGERFEPFQNLTAQLLLIGMTRP